MSKRTWIGTGLLIALCAGGAFAYSRRHHGDPAPTVDAPGAHDEQLERAASALKIAVVVYDGKLGLGWQDWGWGPHQLPVTNGAAKVRFDGFGGILFHHPELKSRHGAFTFRYQAPPSWRDFLSVVLKHSAGGEGTLHPVLVQGRHVAKLADGWREVLIPWSELDPSNLPFDGISIAARRVVSSEWVLLDKIALTESDSGTASAAYTQRDVSLSVLCARPTHRISPLIYGAALGDWSAGLTAQRVGGNAMTRLNWDLANTWNTGKDWFFENVKGDTELWDWLAAGSSHHVQTALTVPMLGWVAKDAVSSGFPRSKFGAQRKYDESRPSAGDGAKPDGSLLPPGSPSETSIPAPPELIARWIGMVRDRDRARGAGRSVLMYLLDNEPSLWNLNHRDVHPEPVGYDELLDRTIRYASAIRGADPDAVIAGPTEWGWTGYFYSAKDREQGWLLRSDRRAHGDVALIPWYLQQLAAHEKSTHQRLLDVLDVHFYPAADGVYGSSARTDAAGAALRLRSTRALWDPTYRDESWIDTQVNLIPMLKGWVSKYYPGLKVSLGEWSFGADNHISGALATAEALGRFGQQGLDSAFYWDGPKAGTKTLQAFRAYRDFDGKGGHFLDISLSTREADNVSLFASRSDDGSQIVAVVVNREPAFATKANIVLDSCGSRISHRVWSFADTSASLVEESVRSGDERTIHVSLPPYSLAVLDIALNQSAAH